MKVLITGAGGFLGQFLAEELLNEGHTLVLTDIFEPPIPQNAKNKENASVLKADLYDAPDSVLSKDLDGIYIFHGIMSAGSEENFDLGYRVNLHSTLRFLEAIRKTCAGVRVIYASSCAVYGTPLPHMPSEATVPTPSGSYGTQKIMIETAINDYNRRGIISGFSLRFPTISVRPGKPSNAASSFMSGMIREPLQGIEAVVPCPDDFECWLCSPRTLIQNLIITLKLKGDCLPPHTRVVLVPGITATVGEMRQALKEVGGEEAVKLLKREDASAEVKGLLDSWGVRYDTSRALGIGMVPDQSFKGAVEDFKASLGK